MRVDDHSHATSGASSLLGAPIVRLSVVAVCISIAVISGAGTWAQQHQAAPQTHAPAAHANPKQAAHEEAAESEGFLPTIAKLLNFAILAGVLVYYLKAPIAAYLDSRSTHIRQ